MAGVTEIKTLTIKSGPWQAAARQGCIFQLAEKQNKQRSLDLLLFSPIKPGSKTDKNASAEEIPWSAIFSLQLARGCCAPPEVPPGTSTTKLSTAQRDAWPRICRIQVRTSQIGKSCTAVPRGFPAKDAFTRAAH